MNLDRIPSSFRDPSGFVFKKDGKLFRQINEVYANNYRQLMDSGLYESLATKSLLISHREVLGISMELGTYKVIEPQRVPFISYPYEWCFSQLKDAALLTLQIQLEAIKFGMILKDASSYNVQFLSGKPVFIDTLSFEKYTEGQSWVAYRQFCQHFFAPLLLMAYMDLRLSSLMKNWIDGIPLDLTSKILPARTYFSLSSLIHIHVHARSQRRHGQSKISFKTPRISKQGLLGLVDNLQTAIEKLKLPRQLTEWGDYYNNTNYSSDSLVQKKGLLGSFLKNLSPKSAWDIGGNTGVFSRLISEKGIHVVSFDIDPIAVEKNYRVVKQNNEDCLLPLVMDLNNPSADIGWANNERMSFLDRAPVDLVFALALIHHLTIGNNLPFDMVANFFQKICRKNLIIEFVPKSDSQVERMLTTRTDIFFNYNQANFESSFSKHFDILSSKTIPGTLRVLYLMKAKNV